MYETYELESLRKCAADIERMKAAGIYPDVMDAVKLFEAKRNLKYAQRQVEFWKQEIEKLENRKSVPDVVKAV